MNSSLTPWYITGFVNADGCFSIHVEKSPESRFGYRFKPVFSITQHTRSQDVIVDIKDFFQCGTVSLQHRSCLNYDVKTRRDLQNVIIPHFLRYPVRSTKCRQFLNWLFIVEALDQKIHTTSQGFVAIVDFLQKNSGVPRSKLETLSSSLTTKYSLSQKVSLETLVQRVPLESLKECQPLEADFITGFVDGDGCFSIGKRKTGRFDASFSLVQSRDSQNLLEEMKKYFGVGNIYYPTSTTSRYMIWNPRDILKTFQSHFAKSPLLTIKHQKWKQVESLCCEKLERKRIVSFFITRQHSYVFSFL